MTENKKSVFETLNAINVNENKSQKNNLDYLSWAWAWQELKTHYPLAEYKIYENKDELNYHHDNKSAWVKVGVTVEGLEHIEYLPVMDFKNQSIKLEAITSMNVNKAIQRALVKAIARHGLGLYIYAGEDLPEPEVKEEKAQQQKAATDANIKKLILRAKSIGYPLQENEFDGKTYQEISDIVVTWKQEQEEKEILTDVNK